MLRITPLIALFLFSLTGCSKESPTMVLIEGTVDAKGQPLSGATITFEPMRKTKGPTATTAVFDGKFKLDESTSLVGGDYRVRISLIPAEIRNSIPSKKSLSMPPADAIVSPKFDGESTLQCELHPGPNPPLHFEIELK